MSENYLPDISPVPSNYQAGDTSKKRGCFLFTLPGILLMSCLGFITLCCVVPIVFCGGLTGFFAYIYSNGESRTDTEVFRLEPSDEVRLFVEDPNAQVLIVPGTSNEIVIDYEITAYGINNSNARDNLDNIALVVERQAGGYFEITVNDESAFDVLGIDLEGFYDLSLTISLPPRVSLIDIDTEQDITIRDINAEYDIQIAGSTGDVLLEGVSGRFQVIASGFNDLTFVGNLDGETQSRFQSDSGDITITVLPDTGVTYTATARAENADVTCPNVTRAKSCTGTIGSGTADLSVISESGDIIIQRGR